MTLDMCTNWGMRNGEQLCGKGSEVSHFGKIESESTVCPGNQKGQLYPGVHQAQCFQQARKEIVSICSAVVWPHLEHKMQVWVPLYKKDIKL